MSHIELLCGNDWEKSLTAPFDAAINVVLTSAVEPGSLAVLSGLHDLYNEDT